MSNWKTTLAIILCAVVGLILLMGYFRKQSEIQDIQQSQLQLQQPQLQLQLQDIRQTQQEIQKSQQEIQKIQDSCKQKEKELLTAIEQAENKHQEYPERRLSEDEVKKVLKDFGDEMQLIREKKKEIPCTLKTYGRGDGGHVLCELKPYDGCVFYSIGISTDYSFDAQVRNETGCFGLAFDPSVMRPSQLVDGVYFSNIGLAPKTGEKKPGWDLMFTLPTIKKMFGHENEDILVLKVDCEGCELNFATAIARENPNFWETVPQFSTELHFQPHLMKGFEEHHDMALLLKQLKEANLELIDVGDNRRCGRGCTEYLREINFICAANCNNLLFANTKHRLLNLN